MTCSFDERENCERERLRDNANGKFKILLVLGTR
jgi:hypothetical protein